MKKKKTTKKKKKNSSFSSKYKYIIYILSALILILGAFLAGTLFENKKIEDKITKQQLTINNLEQKIKKLEKELQKKPKKEIIFMPISSEARDYEQALKTHKPQKEPIQKQPVIKHSSIPKLVIIIDDVAFKNQIKMLKNIPFKITPSFFPPTKRHPNTIKYSKMFSHYMVHVPMEALNFHKPEPDTLKVGDNYEKILNRITSIKNMFPNAKFINNHTGSKFTSDYTSMYYLFKALKENNLGFVDSKTTPNSKSYLVDKKIKIPLYSRNIFLDNIEDPAYIRNQLKKAIKIAKKRGYAIAIGHPHKITLQTLKNSTDLLKNVKVVYIDELN
jgi:polysaccharide deacetylase 2 family uncharacterized protein YibQ